MSYECPHLVGVMSPFLAAHLRSLGYHKDLSCICWPSFFPSSLPSLLPSLSPFFTLSLPLLLPSLSLLLCNWRLSWKFLPGSMLQDMALDGPTFEEWNSCRMNGKPLDIYWNLERPFLLHRAWPHLKGSQACSSPLESVTDRSQSPTVGQPEDIQSLSEGQWP